MVSVCLRAAGCGNTAFEGNNVHDHIQIGEIFPRSGKKEGRKDAAGGCLAGPGREVA